MSERMTLRGVERRRAEWGRVTQMTGLLDIGRSLVIGLATANSLLRHSTNVLRFGCHGGNGPYQVRGRNGYCRLAPCFRFTRTRLPCHCSASG